MASVVATSNRNPSSTFEFEPKIGTNENLNGRKVSIGGSPADLTKKHLGAAQSALNNSSKTPTLPRSSIPTSQHRAQTTSASQPVPNLVAAAGVTPPPSSGTSSRSASFGTHVEYVFPSQKGLDRCLKRSPLMGPYMDEKGITTAAADFFANTKQDARGIVVGARSVLLDTSNEHNLGFEENGMLLRVTTLNVSSAVRKCGTLSIPRPKPAIECPNDQITNILARHEFPDAPTMARCLDRRVQTFPFINRTDFVRAAAEEFGDRVYSDDGVKAVTNRVVSNNLNLPTSVLGLEEFGTCRMYPAIAEAVASCAERTSLPYVEKAPN